MGKKKISISAKGFRKKVVNLIRNDIKDKGEIVRAYWNSLSDSKKGEILEVLKKKNIIDSSSFSIESVLAQEDIFEYFWESIPKQERERLFESIARPEDMARVHQDMITLKAGTYINEDAMEDWNDIRKNGKYKYFNL